MAGNAPKGELKRYPYGRFDPYVGRGVRAVCDGPGGVPAARARAEPGGRRRRVKSSPLLCQRNGTRKTHDRRYGVDLVSVEGVSCPDGSIVAAFVVLCVGMGLSWRDDRMGGIAAMQDSEELDRLIRNTGSQLQPGNGGSQRPNTSPVARARSAGVPSAGGGPCRAAPRTARSPRRSARRAPRPDADHQHRVDLRGDGISATAGSRPKPLTAEPVDVAPAEGHVGQQIDRRATEQRRAGTR